MKPRTIALMVAAGVFGVILNLGLAAALIMHALHLDGHGARPGRHPGLAVAFPRPMEVDGPDLVPLAPAGEPCTREALGTLRGPVVPVRDYTVSGPFTHS